jgi:hypothetical protein
MWCTSSVWPSGSALASRPAAKVPPAPATFSTTTGCPSVRAIGPAIRRATVSVGPPAANGTIIVIGREG